MRFRRLPGGSPVRSVTESGSECSLTVAFLGSVEFDRADKGALANHLRAAAAMVDGLPGDAWAEETEGRRHTYTVPDGPKMLRETLSAAQSALHTRNLTHPHDGAGRHSARLQRLIDECERKRPTGSDGKHGDRHTPECGCLDV